MKLLNEQEVCPTTGTAITIGVYDGVHLGHQAVLRRLKSVAIERNLETAVVTFDPHPLRLLRPELAPKMLSTLEERLQLLNATELVDYCLVLRFDCNRSMESAQHFVEHTLIGLLKARHIVVGENFSCGRGRQGDVSFLRRLGHSLGFEVNSIPLHCDMSLMTTCSSTKVRKFLNTGELQLANQILGRPFEISGTVFKVAMSNRIFVRIPVETCIPAVGLYYGNIAFESQAFNVIPATLDVSSAYTIFNSVEVTTMENVSIPVGTQVKLQFNQRSPRFLSSGVAKTRLVSNLQPTY